jgi:glutaredoxin 3
MTRVEIYTTAFCPYCVRAKRLLQRKGVAYTEIAIDHNPDQMHNMIGRSQRRTVPQIFIDDHPVGGYDDMVELDAFGRLDELLGLTAADEQDPPT